MPGRAARLAAGRNAIAVAVGALLALEQNVGLGDKLVGVLPPNLEIFRPLTVCRRKPVLIFSWGISDPLMMGPIVQKLEKASQVSLLVGYSKSFNDLPTIEEIVKAYWKMGWNVRVLPGCHCKIWLVGDKAYNDSCNFATNTSVNLMCKVPVAKVKDTIATCWTQASMVSQSTKLELVPQLKRFPRAQVT